MPSQIIARADALMHRRRQSDQDFDDIPVLTDSIDGVDDDIPLLTEVETALEQALAEVEDAPPALNADESAQTTEATVESLEALNTPGVTEVPPALAQTLPVPGEIAPALREQLILELSRRIEARIKAALPDIIDSTVRDFLADQDMIANN